MDSTTGRGSTSAAGSTEPETRTDESHPPGGGRNCTALVDRRRDAAPTRGPPASAAGPGK